MLHQLTEFNISTVETNTGQNTLKILSEQHFDLVFLDINFPDISGIEVCKEIILIKPNLKIIAFTTHDEEFIIKQAIASGISGYLLKNIGKEELTKAITNVVNNIPFFSKEITSLLDNLQQLRNETLNK